MDSLKNKNTDNLCRAILSLKTKDDCYNFLEDILTINEFLDISQRFSVACQISQGASYETIRKNTGASTTTISRVGKCYQYGSGGYKKAIKIIEQENLLQND